MIRQTLFIIALLMYAGIIAAWLLKFPISYKLSNGSFHELLVDHDFTSAERDGVAKAYRIRQTISAVLQIGSVVVFGGMYFLKRDQTGRIKTFAKWVMLIAALFAIVLTLVNGIHFIAPSPIR